MTEEIIIDGIDVSKCEVFFKANKTCYNCYACEGSDCYFKQLKRKEQENAEQVTIAENYRSALEDIREKIKSLNKDICNNCGWYNTDNCQPNGYVCHDLIEIQNKINEVLK